MAKIDNLQDIGGGPPKLTLADITGADMRRYLVALGLPMGPVPTKIDPELHASFLENPGTAAMLGGAVELRRREEVSGSTGLRKAEENAFILGKDETFRPF